MNPLCNPQNSTVFTIILGNPLKNPPKIHDWKITEENHNIKIFRVLNFNFSQISCSKMSFLYL